MRLGRLQWRGRRLIQQGGVAVDEGKLTDANAIFSKETFAGDGIIIKKGKKIFHCAKLV